ncbi:unnamed protein product [Protopolystoma xenopodis]|uniref:Uncharacterized protein n=1 Tax=Protopolystoma xenopodis TaxID=117903 RepID=A0A3S5CCQ7_9PLAT|nr:unnamed protein product [Protopolystoma xenopodis]
MTTKRLGKYQVTGPKLEIMNTIAKDKGLGTFHMVLTLQPNYGNKGLDKEWPSLFALITHLTVLPEMLPCPLRLQPICSAANPGYQKTELPKNPGNLATCSFGPNQSASAISDSLPTCINMDSPICPAEPVVRTGQRSASLHSSGAGLFFEDRAITTVSVAPPVSPQHRQSAAELPSRPVAPRCALRADVLISNVPACAHSSIRGHQTILQTQPKQQPLPPQPQSTVFASGVRNINGIFYGVPSSGFPYKIRPLAPETVPTASEPDNKSDRSAEPLISEKCNASSIRQVPHEARAPIPRRSISAECRAGTDLVDSELKPVYDGGFQFNSGQITGRQLGLN